MCFVKDLHTDLLKTGKLGLENQLVCLCVCTCACVYVGWVFLKQLICLIVHVLRGFVTSFFSDLENITVFRFNGRMVEYTLNITN